MSIPPCAFCVTEVFPRPMCPKLRRISKSLSYQAYPCRQHLEYVHVYMYVILSAYIFFVSAYTCFDDTNVYTDTNCSL